MLLDIGMRPLEMLALQRVHSHLMKAKLMSISSIPRLAWNVGYKPQKNHKSKFLTSSLVQDIWKWFAKWSVDTYVDMHIERESKKERALNFDNKFLEALHNKWRHTVHSSKFEYYCKQINTR